jgi:hypothetical protein
MEAIYKETRMGRGGTSPPRLARLVRAASLQEIRFGTCLSLARRSPDE